MSKYPLSPTFSFSDEEDKNLGLIKESSGHGSQSPGTQHRKISIRVDKPQETSGSSTNLNVPSNNIAGSSSNETLTGSTSGKFPYWYICIAMLLTMFSGNQVVIEQVVMGNFQIKLILRTRKT